MALQIPLLAGALGAFFASAIGGIVARGLASVGMGVITYTGVTYALDHAVSMVHGRLGGVPSDVLQLVGLAGFDVFASLVLSAHIGAVSFLMASTGFKRLGFLRED